MFSQPPVDSYQEKFSHLIKTTWSKDRHQASNPPLAEVKPVYQQQAKDTPVKEKPSGYKPLNKYFHAQFRLRPNARTSVPNKKVFDVTFRPKYIVSLKNNFNDLEVISHSICGDVEKETKFLTDRMQKRGLMKDWCAVYEFIDDSPEPKLGKPPVIVEGKTHDGKQEKNEEEVKKEIVDLGQGKEQ